MDYEMTYISLYISISISRHEKVACILSLAISYYGTLLTPAFDK